MNCLKQFLTYSQDFLKLGGSGLLRKFSFPEILISQYPNLLPWKFKCPKDFWEKIENQKKFLLWAEKQLKITQLSDWHQFTEQVSNYSYFFLINRT
jgi:hypothetical protein